jgi:microsomal prostaglandin-E synthase 2
MPALTLYQFELCPFCHKVKAAFDIKGQAYRKVEVNPYTKKELPELPAGTPRKVPVVQYNGRTVQDSTAILDFIEESFPDSTPLLPKNGPLRDKAREVEAWVDDDLAQVLPTVIYGTWGEAVKAAQVTARSSNFGPLQNLMVRAGGSLIMHQISKRIVKRRGGGDPHAMLAAELDKFENWLGDADFVAGSEVSLGDVAAHGALTCIKDFPAYTKVMQRPRLAAWFSRVQALREANRAA